MKRFVSAEEKQSRRNAVLSERYAPCVGSGMCCKKAPCPYGEWDHEKNQCVYLGEAFHREDVTVHCCSRYDYIKQQPGNEAVPAFGEGCCMSLFNENRNKIINAVNKSEWPDLNEVLKAFMCKDKVKINS